ncbi:placenta growth factor isoform X1 [Cuculus canorus]|uniref:placenta growth factor isoform X1 n=1 Tax=Cuculus canorus TaxID=55661 RepID=UPI0023AB16CE|nr:placenta growth factor isoform X1 [Cuculus canorus]
MRLLGAFLRALAAVALAVPVRAGGRDGARGGAGAAAPGKAAGLPASPPAAPASPSPQVPEARGAAGAEPPVLSFREIWNRSFCRPLEQMVDVIAEYPNEVEYIFRPSCVSLQRCGGCCGDEGLRCVPVETSTVTVQLLKIKPNGEAPYVEMVFTEHKRCECRPRQDLMRLGRRRSKGRGKRRQDKKKRKDCELCGTPRR